MHPSINLCIYKIVEHLNYEMQMYACISKCINVSQHDHIGCHFQKPKNCKTMEIDILKNGFIHNA